MLSDAACQPRDTDDCDLDVKAIPWGTDGASVSAAGGGLWQALVAALTVERTESLAAASKASTPST